MWKLLNRGVHEIPIHEFSDSVIAGSMMSIRDSRPLVAADICLTALTLPVLTFKSRSGRGETGPATLAINPAGWSAWTGGTLASAGRPPDAHGCFRQGLRPATTLTTRPCNPVRVDSLDRATPPSGSPQCLWTIGWRGKMTVVSELPTTISEGICERVRRHDHPDYRLGSGVGRLST
jgi:hypothetical protein